MPGTSTINVPTIFDENVTYLPYPSQATFTGFRQKVDSF